MQLPQRLIGMFETKRISPLVVGFFTLSLLTQIAYAQDTVGTEQETTADAEAEDKEVKQQETRKREIGAEEDPAVKQAVEATERRVEEVVERFDLQLYGSVRLRFRRVDSESVWSDGGSRIGLSGGWQVSDNIRLFARGEAGFNLLDQADFLLNRGDRPPGQDFGDTFFRRLLNVGAETPHAVLAVGKAWSTYYRVSSFTDRFQGTGASASGTYNAGTDGGNTGTGRADDVVQVRGFVGPLQRELLRHPLTLNVQVQNGEPIPRVEGKNYKTTVGLSTVYEAKSDWAVGVAYNHANIDDVDVEALRSVGIDGDATALVVGARWYGNNWYVGSVVSRLENHEATSEGAYFEGNGWELYSQYNFHGPWWAVAGWNKLRPDSDQVQTGSFKIDYGVLGIRYSFQGMRQFIYANVRFESSLSQDGEPFSDVYTIGVRWDLP